MRGMRLLSLLLLAAAVPAAAIGAGDEAGAKDRSRRLSSGSAMRLPGWAAERLEGKEGKILGVIFGTADHAIGQNRISFVVVRRDNSIVQVPQADVYVGRQQARKPVRTSARLYPLGPHSHPPGTPAHDHSGATDLYVANVAFPAPGRYWFVVETLGHRFYAVGLLEVAKRSISPAVGSRAFPSRNPTVADAPATQITTARPPDTALLRHSVAGSLKARVPFVVAFATPAFCQSRTCGPVVEVMDEVRKRYTRSGVSFIHIEVYEDNVVSKGLNRWMREWRLPSEPWVFLVDGNGVIRAKFEGAVSVDELTVAVARYLL
jgi:hypothetical protein